MKKEAKQHIIVFLSLGFGIWWLLNTLFYGEEGSAFWLAKNFGLFVIVFIIGYMVGKDKGLKEGCKFEEEKDNDEDLEYWISKYIIAK